MPRPIAFVSMIDSKGIQNLAPFSFFTAVGSNPPVVYFCPVLRGGEEPAKDMLRNVVNIVSEDFVEKMNLTAAEVGPEIDEFNRSGPGGTAQPLIPAWLMWRPCGPYFCFPSTSVPGYRFLRPCGLHLCFAL
jgi:hypothetical protein